MARYTGASCRQCRREGMKLFLKGDRCYTDKCAFVRRSYAPGQHGAAKKKLSNYGVQLREKQKARRIYGVLEGQFRHYYEKADHMKGITGENLLMLLEMRLDNVVYRLGFANSIRQARQMVVHGHILVNGKKVDIPSFAVQVGDEVSLREKSRTNVMFKENFESGALNEYPYLSKDMDKFSGVLTRLPERQEVPIEIDEILIVEFYSK